MPIRVEIVLIEPDPHAPLFTHELLMAAIDAPPNGVLPSSPGTIADAGTGTGTGTGRVTGGVTGKPTGKASGKDADTVAASVAGAGVPESEQPCQATLTMAVTSVEPGQTRPQYQTRQDLNGSAPRVRFHWDDVPLGGSARIGIRLRKLGSGTVTFDVSASVVPLNGGAPENFSGPLSF